MGLVSAQVHRLVSNLVDHRRIRTKDLDVNEIPRKRRYPKESHGYIAESVGQASGKAGSRLKT